MQGTKESYNPYKHVVLGDFVLVRPPYTNVYLLCLVRRLIVVQVDRKYSQYGQFQIWSWRPSKGKKRKFQTSNFVEEDWDGKWECDLSIWKECSSMHYSNSARKNTNTIYLV